ncbi:hypothetical protein GF337_10800 [candidate division KSB1 bacterium]|nr:hypothetical protein [candidate division KSB1 bacterium]
MVMRILLCVILLLGSGFAHGETIDDFIYKAEKFRHDHKLDIAVRLMKEAVKLHPEKPESYSFLGYYLGIQSYQKKSDYLFNSSINLLNKAVCEDPLNPISRFHRGVTLIRYGKLEKHLQQGIGDLELFLNLYSSRCEKLSFEFLLESYAHLAEARMQIQEQHKAILAWEKIIALSPDSPQASRAEQYIQRFETGENYVTLPVQKIDPNYVKSLERQLQRSPQNVNTLIDLSEAYFHLAEYDATKGLCQKALELDYNNIRAIKLSALAALKDEDSTFHKNTIQFSEILFKLDCALKNAPADKELHLIRGILIAEISQNEKRLQQAFNDLNYILNSYAPECLKKQALQWLEITHQKMLITSWNYNSLVNTVAQDAKPEQKEVQM